MEIPAARRQGLLTLLQKGHAQRLGCREVGLSRGAVSPTLLGSVDRITAVEGLDWPRAFEATTRYDFGTPGIAFYDLPE